MKTVSLIQGTSEWHAHRAQHFNASDAPAMLGCSPYKTRAQLVREVATGITQEVDAATQRRFDDGHHYEAKARPLAEEIIGDELYPCVGVSDCGRYSASFDGLTLMEDIAFEHKSLNDDLRACMRDEGNGWDLPKHYQVQMEQQLLVSGAERVLFMASKWNGDELVEERHCWYPSDPKLRAEILAGWEQFAADVAAYIPEAAAAPAAMGRAPETLPSLRVEVTGMVTASNLAEFKASALAVLGGINRDLQTDDDFANAEQTVKWCKDVEDRLAATKEAVLAQTTDIEAVFRTMDEVSAETRRIRLELDRLVKAEKENRKAEIVAAGREAVVAHYGEINAGLEEHALTIPPGLTADLGAAIKGKKSLASMRDAIDAAVANAKVAASTQGLRVLANVSVLGEYAEHAALFADRVQLCATKAPDDLRNLAKTRIAEHQQREAERLERERERIRQEEVERLERERRADPAKNVSEATSEPETQPCASGGGQQGYTGALRAAGEPGRTIAKPPISSGARVKLGDINARIAPLSITADGLASLGFEAVGQQRAAKLYAERDFPLICAALVDLLTRAATRQEAA